MAKESKPAKLFGRQISKVAEQAEQELGPKADPAKLADRASEMAQETFGVSHDFTADYFLKRREKAGSQKQPQAEAQEKVAPRQVVARTADAGRAAGAGDNGNQQTATRGDDITLAELRALRSKLADDKTDVGTLAELLPRIEAYTRIAGNLDRLRQAVEFLNEKE